MSIIEKLKNSSLISKYKNSDKRSKRLIENTLLSLIMKGANILASLLIVPMTINYINPSQYGIWLTLSSIIGWVVFFDLGLGNGFRNKFTEAKAKGDIVLARQYLSTTYFAIATIVCVVYLFIIIINSFIDWTTILKVSSSYKDELHKIFYIICAFTSLNMIANIFATLLSADQKPGYASVIQGISQYLSLIVIYILTKVSDGSLTSLAFFYSGIPFIVMAITSILMFRFSSYREVSPKIRYIKLGLIKNIMSLGTKFFIIYLCLIAVFQVVNIVISREIGTIGVTQYNIAQKYFGIIYMIMIIIITPLWSAFTDAYAKRDITWMQNMVQKMEKLFLACILLGTIMLFLSSYFYELWIGDSVTISTSLSIAMLFFVIAQTYGNIYMYMLNGIGTIRIQLIVYVCFAILAWPLFTFSSRTFGLVGVVIIPSTVYLFQGIIGKIQISKILNNKATGLWGK